jgi:hypothetical protein
MPVTMGIKSNSFSIVITHFDPIKSKVFDALLIKFTCAFRVLETYSTNVG